MGANPTVALKLMKDHPNWVLSVTVTTTWWKQKCQNVLATSCALFSDKSRKLACDHVIVGFYSKCSAKKLKDLGAMSLKELNATSKTSANLSQNNNKNKL